MEISKEKAIELFNSKIWKDWDDEKKFLFQINQSRLCMPFDVFHEAVEKVLGRPVYTHEFATPRPGGMGTNLMEEYIEKKVKS